MQDKKCPVYKKCNGCQLMNMSYEEQLRFKEIKCVRSLGKYGRVEKIVPMDNPYFYRNKVQGAIILTTIYVSCMILTSILINVRCLYGHESGQSDLQGAFRS